MEEAEGEEGRDEMLFGWNGRELTSEDGGRETKRGWRNIVVGRV